MIRKENVKEKQVRIKVDRAKPKNSAIDGSNEKSPERDSLRMARRRSTLIQFIQQRFLANSSTSDSDERRDDISKSNGKGGNPLLILLLVCVIVTWGVAATLVFDLVDYKGLVEKGKNIGSEIQEEDIKNAVGALYPFQYEIVRHPIRSLGQGLINIDDYITEALSPRKDPYQLTDSRKDVPPCCVIKRLKKRASWADELPAEDIIPQKRVKANKTIEFKKYPKL